MRRKFAPRRGAGGAAGALNGTIIALDILPIEPIEGVDFIQGDFREAAVLAQLEARARPAGRSTSCVSDMAPNLSGIAAADAARIDRPGRAGDRIRRSHLKPEGALVCKVFHGSGYSQLVERFKDDFPDRQADQAQGVAGQVGRDLPGRASA